MGRLILIETSTALCSTAISENGRIICSRESCEPRAHASKTAAFIKEMLDELHITAKDCDAVAVSSGPGSYTGLRVGSSTAKGLCFGADLPLIAVSTPEILCRQALESGEAKGMGAIVSMIDARRMEVYTQQFDSDGNAASEVTPIIIDADSFADLRAKGPVLFIGDGAAKCEPVLGGNGNKFIQVCPTATAMAGPAEDAFNNGRFENTAYFEPFYLKQFVATVSKKNVFDTLAR